MENSIYLYSLNCPITGETKYIGKTIDTHTRMRKHLTAQKKTATSKWIFSLKSKGLKPVMNVIATVSKKTWQDEERKLILRFRSLGAPLLNHTIGGEGGNTMGGRTLTDEQRKKISDHKKGKKRDDCGVTNKKLKGFQVNQFDLSGNYITTHESVRDAARYIGRDSRRIQFMVKGEKNNGKNVNHVGGFIFKRAG